MHTATLDKETSDKVSFITFARCKFFLPYFEKVKMLVGITKQKKNAKKIQYLITAIEPVE
jgi:hypothetical protein